MSNAPTLSAESLGPTCWICLEGEGEVIRPCKCRNGWAHRSCLDSWRFGGVNPNAFKKCVNCLASYDFEIEDQGRHDEVYAKLASTWCLRFAAFLGVLAVSLLGASALFGILSYWMDPEKNIPAFSRWSFDGVLVHSFNQTEVIDTAAITFGKTVWISGVNTMQNQTWRYGHSTGLLVSL
eukprot:gene4911-888_t